MNELPSTGFLRLPQVLKVIPVGKTTWWAGCKIGRFPRPLKISRGLTVWRAEDIHALIAKISGDSGADRSGNDGSSLPNITLEDLGL
jgi:predicted DNA-binding transcriptional regulator AlpA